jgi:hypothetical protein
MAYPVTDDFKTAVTQDHRMASKVEVTDAFGNVELVLSTVGDGQVTEDVSQTNRWQAQFTAVDEDGTLTPTDVEGILTPYHGHEFRPYRGVYHAVLGDIEYVPLGVYRFTRLNIDDSGTQIQIRAEGIDRSKSVQRAKILETVVIPDATPTDEAVMMLLSGMNASWEYDMEVAANYTVNRLVFVPGDDRWAAIKKIAESCGCDVYFNDVGTFVMKPTPNPAYGEVNWVLEEGANGTMVYVGRALSTGDDDVYNGVVVTVTSTANGAPIRAEAWDNDPNSPTYVGTFGQAPFFYETSAAKDLTQAQAIADSMLPKLLGLQEEVQVQFIPNPAIRCGDIVQVNRPRVGLNDEILVVEQTSVPLVAERVQDIMSRHRQVS